MSIQQMLLAGPGGNDPFFSSVVLLLHLDGPGFVDSSSYNHTMTAVGSPTISALQSKWGGASLLNAASSGLVTAGSLSEMDLSTGDFTLEAWVRTTSHTPTNGIFGQRSTTVPFGPFSVFTEASTGRPRFWASTTGSSWDIQINGGSTPTLTTWHFWQATRSGSTFTLYVDGTSYGTASSAGALMTNTAGMAVAMGATDGSFSFSGNVDDVRVTKGVARPNVVPIAAFPNS